MTRLNYILAFNRPDQILKLSDIVTWNSYKLIKRIIEIKGYYACLVDDKKTLIIN
jgi:hypothetical protein